MDERKQGARLKQGSHETRLKRASDPKPGGKRSFGATMKAVMWSFVGLRRKSDYDVDVGGLNPVYVIVAGLIGAAVFIGLLVTIVKLVVAQ